MQILLEKNYVAKYMKIPDKNNKKSAPIKKTKLIIFRLELSALQLARSSAGSTRALTQVKGMSGSNPGLIPRCQIRSQLEVARSSLVCSATKRCANPTSYKAPQQTHHSPTHSLGVNLTTHKQLHILLTLPSCL